MEQTLQEKLVYLPEALLPWYDKSARQLPWRETKEPYHIWLSEIMLQQTRVEAVKGYYKKFLDALPDVKSLAEAEDMTLLKLWEGLGYYSRVRNLKKAATMIMSQFKGVFPDHYEDILSLPGIGDYTAGAIASICFDRPKPAVDGNVLRVIARIGTLDTPIDHLPFKKKISSLLEACYPKKRCGDFTQSLMELGATVCVPNGAPHCALCPIRDICNAYKINTQEEFPKRSSKKLRKIEEHTVFLLKCGDKFAVCRREPHGLLAGMWEFPNTPGTLSKEQAVSYLKNLELSVVDIVHLAKRKHIFTHIEWNMLCYTFTVEKECDAFIWVTKDFLSSQIALPTAFRQFCELLEI